MKKTTVNKRLLLICSFLFLLVPFASAQDTSGSHMLWKVSSDQGTEGYVVGSIHLVKPDIYPLDEAFQKSV